jgi:hypothetical protein
MAIRHTAKAIAIASSGIALLPKHRLVLILGIAPILQIKNASCASQSEITVTTRLGPGAFCYKEATLQDVTAVTGHWVTGVTLQH